MSGAASEAGLINPMFAFIAFKQEGPEYPKVHFMMCGAVKGKKITKKLTTVALIQCNFIICSYSSIIKINSLYFCWICITSF